MIDWLVFSINYGISCLSDLLVEETRVSGENHQNKYHKEYTTHLSFNLEFNKKKYNYFIFLFYRFLRD
jgi:hypothetical protein